MRKLSRKALSIVMSVVLVVGLCPGLAYAGERGEDALSSTVSTLQAGSAADIQAGMTSQDESDEGDGRAYVTVAAPNWAQLESEHDYADSMDTTWVYTDESAIHGMAATFSDNTMTESGCDYITLYDGNDNVILKASGDQLAGFTFYVQNSTTFKIRLTTDGSVTNYGFKVTGVRALEDGEEVPSNIIPGSSWERDLVESALLIDGAPAADWSGAYRHTGQAIKPAVTFDPNVISLVEGVDYTVRYYAPDWEESGDPVSVGRYSFEVASAGDHAGWWISRSFVIYGSAEDFAVYVDGLSMPEALTSSSVYEAEQALYTAQAIYSAMPEGDQKAVPAATLEKLSAFEAALDKLIPMYRVEWTINGKSAGAISEGEFTFPYDGKSHELEIAATYNGDNLVEGVDYEVVYQYGYGISETGGSEPVAPGTYSVGIRGIGGTFYGVDERSGALVITMDSASAILYQNGDFVIQPGTEPDGSTGHTAADVAKVYASVDERVEMTSEYGYTYDGWAWQPDASDIRRVSVIGPTTTTTMGDWFENCGNLVFADLSGLLLGGLDSVNYLFSGCKSLESVDYSGLDFSAFSSELNYTGSAYGMYDDCWSLSRFTFNEGTVLASYVLPEGAWTSPDGNTVHASTEEFVKAFNANPVVGTWQFSVKKDLANADVSWGRDKVAYIEGGLPIVSNTVSSVSFNGTQLQRGVDYELVVVDADGNPAASVPISEGKYFVRVSGLGDFAGTAYGYDRPISVIDQYDLASVMYGGSYSSRYSGRPYTNYSGSYTNSVNGESMMYNVDFAVTFETLDGKPVEPIEPGQYVIVYTGIGLYHGTQRGTLTIADKNDLGHASVSTNGTVRWIGRVVSAVLVSACGVPLEQGEDYVITYYDADGNALDSINAPGVYSFRISAGSNGAYKGSYSSSSRAISVTDGEAEPVDAHDLANATLYADGKSTHVRHTSTNSWSMSEAYVYDYGEGATPAITVSAGGEELVEGVHYAVDDVWKTGYWDSASVAAYPLKSGGSYYFTVSAIEGGGYTGSAMGYVYVRDGRDISNGKLSIGNSSTSVNGVPLVEYTGEPVDVQASMTIGGVAVASSNYELLFAPCEGDPYDKGQLSGAFTAKAPTEPGLYCVYAQAVGSGYSGMFKGDRSDYYNGVSPVYIQVGNPSDIGFARVYNTTNCNYTGASVHPVFYPSYSGKTLVEGSDYEIAGYKDAEGNRIDEAVEEGTYTAVLRGIGNMTGQLEAPFRVREYGNFSTATLALDSYNVAYTGQEVYPSVTVTLDGEELVQGLDYVIESVEPSSYGNVYSGGLPIAMGSYTMTLRGVSARGVVGVRDISYSIVDPRNLSYATMEELGYTYSYTGSAVNPKPVVKLAGKILSEGDDYVIEYTRSYTDESGDYVTDYLSDCVDEGRYTLRIVGYGDYVLGTSRSFQILKPEHDYSKANVYVVKNGVREELKSEYAYTGGNVLDGQVVVELDGKALDPKDYIVSLRDYSTSGSYSSDMSAVQPGRYNIFIYPADASEYYGYNHYFTIAAPSVTEQGVQASGDVFLAKADPEAGVEVTMTVEEKTEGSTATAREVVEACEQAQADYVGIVDVSLDVVNSRTGAVVEELTEGFGELSLSFEVGEQYNGSAARVVQVHTDATSGVITALRHPVSRVVDGRVSITVDRLSEFIIMVGANAEELDFERPEEVAKPQATDYAYDGAEHAGVSPSKGYVLSGKVTATEVGVYTVTATLAGGYQWSDGTADPVELTWRIYKAEKPTEPSDAIDLSAAVVALSQSSFTYDGKAKKPDVKVTLGGKVLESGVDYTVSYANNVEVGTATATVTGKGNYTGTATATFAIAAAQPSGDASGSGGSQAGGSSGSSSGGASGSSGASQPAAPAVQSQAMHRLYNPNSGEHFYTADEGERDAVAAVGWKYEGVGWTAPATSDTPVYRLYNKYGGEHHYCTDKGERDALVAAGWADEGVGWYSDDAKGVPLYREYNPNAFANNHNYTTDKDEHEWLLSLGWKDEGYAWYGVK